MTAEGLKIQTSVQLLNQDVLVSTQVSVAKLERHMFFQGFVIIVFHIFLWSFALSLFHTHTLFLKHKSTCSLIFQSFLLRLLCTWLHLLRRPLSFFLPGGKVSDKARAEKRALICINLQPISGEREQEGERERATVYLLTPTPLHPPPPALHHHNHCSYTETGTIQSIQLSPKACPISPKTWHRN